MVWLVTGDRDFASGTPLCLNPLLFRELRTVAPNAVVRLYGKSPGHLVQAVNNFFDERGLADARFSEEQIDYFDHLAEIAEREREPWQCGRGDGSNTPIEDATCADCGAQLEQALREEQYAVRRVADGYEIELLDDRDGAAPGPERCGNCPSTTFEIEFESLCSYCKRVLGSC